MNIHSGKIAPDFSISNLCASKNIYTIPDVDDKFALEKWYATNIDAIYPEVYRLVIDDRVLKINEQQRQKILNTCLNANKWIIGKNGDIDKHLADQKSFNEGTTEKDMADFRHVVTEMTKLVAVMEKEGFSLYVIGKLKEFLHDPRFRKDKTFMEHIKSLCTKRVNT